MTTRDQLRVPSTTRPGPESEPYLVTGQPVDGPRNNGVRYGINRKPLELQWIMEAEDGLLGTEPVRVVVRDRLSRGLRSSAQQWGFHGDTRIARQNRGPQDIPIQAEDDPDSIGLAEWPKSPRPPDPAV